MKSSLFNSLSKLFQKTMSQKKKWIIATLFALFMANIPHIQSASLPIAEKVLGVTAPIIESAGNAVLNAGKVGVVLAAATLAKSNTGNKDESSKPETPNPNPNVISHNGSISLEIPVTNTLAEQNPVIVEVASAVDSSSKKADEIVTKTHEETESKEKAPSAATESKTDTPTQISTQSRQIQDQTKAQDKSTPECIATSTTDFAKEFVDKKRKEEHERSVAANAEIQSFVQSGIESSLNQTKAGVNQTFYDAQLTQLRKNHPDQLEAFMRRMLSERYGVSADQLTNIVKNIHLHPNGDVEIEYTPEYESQIGREACRARQVTLRRAIASIGYDLGRIKEFVVTSKSLHKKLRHADLPKELIIYNNFTFIGVTATGLKLYRSNPIHGHAHKDRVVELWIDDDSKIKAHVKSLDKISDAYLIKPQGVSATSFSAGDTPAVVAITPAAVVTGTSMPPGDPENPSSSDDDEDDEKDKVKEKEVSGVIQDVEESLDEIMKKDNDHIFSKDHKENGIMKLGESEEEIKNMIKHVVRSVNARGELAPKGDTQIKTNFNKVGFDTEIRIHIKNGKLMKVDAFRSKFGRIFGKLVVFDYVSMIIPAIGDSTISDSTKSKTSFNNIDAPKQQPQAQTPEVKKTKLDTTEPASFKEIETVSTAHKSENASQTTKDESQKVTVANKVDEAASTKNSPVEKVEATSSKQPEPNKLSYKPSEPGPNPTPNPNPDPKDSTNAYIKEAALPHSDDDAQKRTTTKAEVVSQNAEQPVHATNEAGTKTTSGQESKSSEDAARSHSIRMAPVSRQTQEKQEAKTTVEPVVTKVTTDAGSQLKELLVHEATNSNSQAQTQKTQLAESGVNALYLAELQQANAMASAATQAHQGILDRTIDQRNRLHEYIEQSKASATVCPRTEVVPVGQAMGPKELYTAELRQVETSFKTDVQPGRTPLGRTIDERNRLPEYLEQRKVSTMAPAPQTHVDTPKAPQPADRAELRSSLRSHFSSTMDDRSKSKELLTQNTQAQEQPMQILREQEMRRTAEIKREEALQREVELRQSQELIRQQEFRRRYEEAQRLEMIRREEENQRAQEFYRMQEFRRQEAFERAEAYRRAQEAQIAEQARIAREICEAIQAEAERRQRAAASVLLHYKMAAFDNHEEAPELTNNPTLKADAEMTAPLYSKLMSLYDRSMLHKKGRVLTSTTLFKLLKDAAKNASKYIQEYYEAKKMIEIDMLAFTAYGPMPGLNTGFIMERYAERGREKYLALWTALRQTMENPEGTATKDFYMRAHNLETYYQNSPNIIQELNDFRRHTGSPIQLNIHESMVPLITEADDLFDKYVNYPAESNKNDNVKYTTSVVLNFLFIAKALNDSNRFEEAMMLTDMCSNLLSTEKAIAQILDKHESRFWNALWYGENFSQRLAECLEKSSNDERISVTNAIGGGASNLAKVLQYNCEQSLQNRRLFLSQSQSVIDSNAHGGYVQAGQQAVPLITTTLGRAIAPDVKTGPQIEQIGSAIQQAVGTEQEQALEALERFRNKSFARHNKCLHPTNITLIDAVAEADHNIREQLRTKPAGETAWQDEAPTEFGYILEDDLQEFPRPLQVYLQHAQGVNRNNHAAIRAIILQCDNANRNLSFAEPRLNDPQVIQLPTLYQLYDGLEVLETYGREYAMLCGYYAAHVAKIFATHPRATQQELVMLLNNRNDFEQQTLIPGKQIIRGLRGQATGDIADLQGDEIGLLLPQEMLDRTIIVGGGAENDALHNEEILARATLLSEKFISGKIDYLIFILPTNGRNHWIPLLVRRGENRHIQLILTDSTGIDRRATNEVRNVYLQLATPEQLATEQPKVNQLESNSCAVPVGLHCEFEGSLEFTISQRMFDAIAIKEDARRSGKSTEMLDACSIHDIYIRSIAGDSGTNCYFKLTTQQWVWLWDSISICIRLTPCPNIDKDVYFCNVFNRPLSFNLTTEEYDHLKVYLEDKSCRRVNGGVWDVELAPKQFIKFPAKFITNLVLKTKILP